MASERGALGVGDGHLRRVADEQVARFDCRGIVVVRGDVGTDVAGVVERIEQLAAGEVEVVVTRRAANDQVRQERCSYASSLTASTTALGCSWGRLWPAAGIRRRSYLAVKWGADQSVSR